MASEQLLITDTNKSPLIQVLAWMFMVISILACAARTGTKFYMVKTLKFDDCLAVGATVASIAQVIATVVQSLNGLGQYQSALTEDQVSRVLKSGYAADGLFIVGLFLAKASGAATVINIAQRSHKNIILGIQAVIALWAVTGFFVVMFQCRLPAPWDFVHQQCIQRSTFWIYFGIVNIVTDIAVIVIMVINVRQIQTTWSKKVLVLSVFGSRILVTPAIAFEIYYSSHAINAADPIFDMWKLVVSVQVVQCLSILTICIPNLKPFLDSLESGQIRVDDLRRQGKSSSNGYGSYNRGVRSGQNSSGNANSKNSKNRSNRGIDTLASHSSQKGRLFELVEIPKGKKGTSSTEGTRTDNKDKTVAWDGQSHTSQTILIQQTKTWHVDVESRRDSSD